MVPPRSRFHGKEDELSTDVLRRVKRRDPAAMDQFFEHYYDRIYAHVVNMLRDPVLGEDLCQDIFLRLHRTVESLDSERSPTGWVFTVATNVVRDHWRSREHKRAERELGGDDPARFDVAHPDPGVQAVMEKDEELRAVWQSLHLLSSDDREIILLRDYEELDTETIAAMLDLNPDAVRQRHSRAVTRLGKTYRERSDAMERRR